MLGLDPELERAPDIVIPRIRAGRGIMNPGIEEVDSPGILVIEAPYHQAVIPRGHDHRYPMKLVVARVEHVARHRLGYSRTDASQY